METEEYKEWLSVIGDDSLITYAENHISLDSPELINELVERLKKRKVRGDFGTIGL